MNIPITCPTARADQLRAAAGHADTVLRSLATTPGARHVHGTPSTWLIQHAAVLLTALDSHTVKRCPHAGQSPQLLHAAVWAPGRLVCTACLPTLTPTPGTEHTCDRCHRTRPLIPGIAALGPVLLIYGLCRQCTPAAVPNPTPRKDHQ
jgi:hypothetical protein